MDNHSSASLGGTAQQVDARLWAVMNEIYVAAHVLKAKHNEVHQQGHRLAKSDKPAEKAEYNLVKGTGGDPWFGLCRALKEVKPVKTAARDGKVLVRYEDAKARMDVKVALRVLVDRMCSLGKASGLVSDGSDKKPVGYNGPLLRPAVNQSLQALAEWDNYMAETHVSHLLNRLRQPGYAPPASQNQLALPAPGVASHRTPRSGLE